MLQPEPRSGEGCNTLSHEGLANVNIRKGMLYRHCYIYGGLDGGGGGVWYTLFIKNLAHYSSH